jgi:cyclic pyranopterin phosphate synthase
MTEEKLTHIDENGRPKMVYVGEKEDTDREAVASGKIFLSKKTFNRLKEGDLKKGDVLSTAQIAGIMGAKKTSEIIPMCHNIFITGVEMEFDLNEKENSVEITARATTTGKTGIEMESLTAVSVAALTIYDMCKAVDKNMIISDIKLAKKTGGKSGTYIREE